MFQYRAILKSNKEVICEGHTLQDLEKKITHWKRLAKKGVHTRSNEAIEIMHVRRDEDKEILLKVI